MDQKNVMLSAVEKTSAVTLTSNRKLRQDVTSAHVPYGKLDSGIRYAGF